MGKLTTYILLMTGISLMFYIGGLIELTNNPLLALLLNPSSLSSTAFYSTLLTTIAGVGAAFYIGFVQKNIELAAATVYIPYLASVLWSFTSVYTVLSSEMKIISLVIFSPLLILFTVTIFEAWRGTD